MEPTAERERELIDEWHDLLAGLIGEVEEERDVLLDKERAALGMLCYLASKRREGRAPVRPTHTQP